MMHPGPTTRPNLSASQQHGRMRAAAAATDERTPLLATQKNAGPSTVSPRKHSKGSRASASKRHPKPSKTPSAAAEEDEESGVSWSDDAESLTRRTTYAASSSSLKKSSRRGSCSCSPSKDDDASSTLCDASKGNASRQASAGNGSGNRDGDGGRGWGVDGAATASGSRSLLARWDAVSLRLENSGSVARDHLAAERTFLAYMRTSLAIASAGVALVQLFSAAAASIPEGSTHRLHTYVRPLGASTIGIGMIVLVIGVARYFKIQAALTKGYFPVSRITSGLIAIMLSVLVTVTFAVLLSGKMEPRRK